MSRFISVEEILGKKRTLKSDTIANVDKGGITLSDIKKANAAADRTQIHDSEPVKEDVNVTDSPVADPTDLVTDSSKDTVTPITDSPTLAEDANLTEGPAVVKRGKKSTKTVE